MRWLLYDEDDKSHSLHRQCLASGLLVFTVGLQGAAE